VVADDAKEGDRKKATTESETEQGWWGDGLRGEAKREKRKEEKKECGGVNQIGVSPISCRATNSPSHRSVFWESPRSIQPSDNGM